MTLQVVGTLGTLDVDAFAQAGELFSDEVGHSQYYFWGDDADQAMVQDFVDCIRQQKEPRASGLDGLRATEVALGAYQAARELRPIKLR